MSVCFRMLNHFKLLRVFIILLHGGVQVKLLRASEGQRSMYAVGACHVFIMLTDDPLYTELSGNTKQITRIIRLRDTFYFGYWSSIKHLCHREIATWPPEIGFVTRGTIVLNFSSRSTWSWQIISCCSISPEKCLIDDFKIHLHLTFGSKKWFNQHIQSMHEHLTIVLNVHLMSASMLKPLS